MKLSKFVKFTNFDDINHVGFWISHTVWDFSHLALQPERLDVCLWAKPFALPEFAFLPSKCSLPHPHCHSGWLIIPTYYQSHTELLCSRCDSLFQLWQTYFAPMENLIWLKKKISVAYLFENYTKCWILIFLGFFTNICPTEIDLFSGFKVNKIDQFWHFWWTFVHSKCNRCSLCSQSWIGNSVILTRALPNNILTLG